MSNPTLDAHLGAPDPNFMPTSVAELYSDIDQRLTAEFTGGTYLPYVIGSSTPAVGDQDKAWIKTDGAGRPLGTFVYYSGNWRRAYTGSLHDIKMFIGNPTGVFDSTGLGILGTDQDGWALANGNNGTFDLSNFFLVGANMNNTSGAGQYGGSGWQSLVDGISAKRSGGAATFTLTATNTYRPPAPALIADLWSANANARSPTGDMYGVVGGGTNSVLVAADPGVPTPPAVPKVSPFIALGFAQFIGYA